MVESGRRTGCGMVGIPGILSSGASRLKLLAPLGEAGRGIAAVVREWGQVAQGAVEPDGVVPLDPAGNQDLGRRVVGRLVAGPAFLAERPVVALHRPIRLRVVDAGPDLKGDV